MRQEEQTRRVVDIEKLGRKAPAMLGFGTVTTDVKTGEPIRRVRSLEVEFPVKRPIGARIETYAFPMKVEAGQPVWSAEYVYVRSIMAGKISLWRHLKFWWRSLWE